MSRQPLKHCLILPSLNRRSVDDVEFVHKVNVIGPLRVSQAMLPLLKKGHKKLVSIHTHACMLHPQVSLAPVIASAWCTGLGPKLCAVLFLSVVPPMLCGGLARTLCMLSAHLCGQDLCQSVYAPIKPLARNASWSDIEHGKSPMLFATVQIANVSSTLGSIGDKAQYIKNDDARRANPFAAKIVAYKMAKVRPEAQCSCISAIQMHREYSHHSVDSSPTP